MHAVVKIFSNSLACAKIKRTKYMCNIDVVCLKINVKIYRMKYFRHKIFAIPGNRLQSERAYMHACETKLPMQELMQGAYARGGGGAIVLYYS